VTSEHKGLACKQRRCCNIKGHKFSVSFSDALSISQQDLTEPTVTFLLTMDAMKSFALIEYSIAICPHCDDDRNLKRTDHKVHQSEDNELEREVIRLEGAGVMRYRYVCRQDGEGKDIYLVKPCERHEKQELEAQKREGREQRMESLKVILTEARKKQSIPHRFEIREYGEDPFPHLFTVRPTITAMLRDWTIVDRYRLGRTKTIARKFWPPVDWVNHPTRILVEGSSHAREVLTDREDDW
jgi:hypothetical protein